jgi:hypothetical protein
LSARLEMSALQYIDWNTLLFLGLLVFIARPLAVMLSSIGTQMGWREQTFLSWMAPRGIVAAAVASLFAFELQSIYPQEAEALVPVVFAIVVGTVAIYGLTAAPLARWLGLADPNPQGVLFVGATAWVRQIAHVVQDLGFSARLIDANPDHVKRARKEGLSAERVNALAESAIDEIDWGGIGRLLIMIPNDEVGSLAALHFSEAFETTKIYQLAAHPDSRITQGAEMPKHLRGRPLFGEATSFDSLHTHFQEGYEIQAFNLSEGLTADMIDDYFGNELYPLFVLRSPNTLQVVSEYTQLSLQPGDKLVALVDPEHLDDIPFEAISFDELGTEALAKTEVEAASTADSADEAHAKAPRKEEPIPEKISSASIDPERN